MICAPLDEVLVPQTSILFVKRDEISSGCGPGLSSRLLEEHEGEKPEYFGFGKHGREEARDADSLLDEVAPDGEFARAGRIALVIDEVNDFENIVKSLS